MKKLKNNSIGKRNNQKKEEKIIPLLPIIGNVDIVKTDFIEGWVHNPNNNLKSSNISVLWNGRNIGTFSANKFRQDLKDLSIGNGEHGFAINLPKNIKNDDEIKLVEIDSGMEIPGSPIKIKKISDLSILDNKPIIYIDLSDLIFYLEHHDNLTGIQRVQANIFNAIIDNSLYPYNKIKVLYFKESDLKFYSLDISFISALLSDYQKSQSVRKFKRQSDGKLNLDQLIEKIPMSPTDGDYRNSFLIMLGAAWVFPNYFQSVNALRRSGLRFIPLVHDLIPIIMPALCDKGTAEVFKIFLKRLILSADHILTVSENTKRDLLSYCKNNYKDNHPAVTVSVNGQEPIDFLMKIKPSILNEDYILFVSTIEGRKNHRLAFEVWEKLIEEYGENTPALVFVGRLGWRAESLIEKLYESNFLNKKIILLSDISDDDLTALYQNCLFTFYPSLYEGWGLPVAESLSFGKVCIASNSSSIPEVGGELVQYFDSNNVDDAFSCIRNMIENPNVRIKNEKDIKLNFRPVTWIDSANKIINTLQEINSNGIQRNIYPILSIGEYNFGRINYMESNVSHGDEVAKYVQNFSASQLLYKPLSLESYVLGENCLSHGIWYSAEDWGRWGHSDGNTISFLVDDSNRNYLLIFKLNIPQGIEIDLDVQHRGRTMSRHYSLKGVVLLRLEGSDYRNGCLHEITFKPTNTIPSIESRSIGIGFIRLALIDSSSIEQRIEIIEKQLFC